MARPKPLVCQHLENISRGALEQYQDIVRQYVRNRQGVYVLYRRGKLYYVGLASNLRSRLGHHLKDRHAHSWDRFSVYLTIGDSHLRELESLILRIVKPPGNKQKGRLPKSEDLRRKFRRDIKCSWLLEIQELLGTKAAHPATKKKAVRMTGKRPVLAQFQNRPTTLRVRYKGKTHFAYVRKTGLIWFAGRHFKSPSMAGSHLVKGRACNGWTFWQYQRAPGDWVLLDELRK